MAVGTRCPGPAHDTQTGHTDAQGLETNTGLRCWYQVPRQKERVSSEGGAVATLGQVSEGTGAFGVRTVFRTSCGTWLGYTHRWCVHCAV